MKQLYRFLLPLSVAPRAYLGARVAPATVEIRPVLAAATVVAPLAAPARLAASRVRFAKATMRWAEAMPITQTLPAASVRSAPQPRAKSSDKLVVKALSPLLLRRPLHRSPEAAGTPTGLEGLGGALLKMALFLTVLLVVLGMCFLLLIKLIVRFIHPKEQAEEALGS
jgi:hypothetical protein